MCTYVMPVHDQSGTTVGVFFADVPMEDVSLLSIDIYNGIISSRKVLFGIQVVSLIIIGFIIWMAVKSFKRYKGRYVDPEKSHLIEETEQLKEANARLKEVNTRLTKRNQELAEKVAQLHEQTTTSTSTTNSYTSDTTW
jgi:large-conductance mechanosensitive channel